MTQGTRTPTPEDLRLEIARRRQKLYELAPLVGLNPSRIGMLLNGHLPMPDDVAQRIAAAIERLGPRR